MKNYINIFLSGLFVIVLLHNPTAAQNVSKQEARIIAENWISVVLDKSGSWGEYDTAVIESIQDFKRKERKLGFFCNVKPRGFLILSQRKELAPVKAYSTSSNLNPNLNDEGTAFLKTSIDRIIDTIESRLGFIKDIQSSDLKAILDIDYSQTWEQVYNYKPGTWVDPTTKNSMDNYLEGEIMLEGNNWHQFPPYNEDCPWLNCSTSNGNAVVGCVATAGAQIMHYWDWPPYGNGGSYGDTYDWPNMPDVATTSSPQAEIDALAELNHEVGVAVGMSYGCDGSGATTSDMVAVYEIFYRYSTACNVHYRIYYTPVDWFERIKTQLNLNRPIQYRIPGHSIVVDGWQESGSPLVREYHVNYGWTGTGNDTWWLLDAIPGSEITGDYIIESIVPATALGNWLNGTYNAQSFPYRYFDRDATGYGATFGNGQFLQFLPEVTVTGIGATDPIKFYGTDYLIQRLFTGGDISNGIRIYDASIELTNFGSIKFYDD